MDAICVADIGNVASASALQPLYQVAAMYENNGPRICLVILWRFGIRKVSVGDFVFSNLLDLS
jgi:hypothetical protein